MTLHLHLTPGRIVVTTGDGAMLLADATLETSTGCWHTALYTGPHWQHVYPTRALAAGALIEHLVVAAA